MKQIDWLEMMKSNQTKYIILFVTAILSIIVLVMGINIMEENTLTLENIHEKVVLNKTTKDEIKGIFGNPINVETNKKKVISKYEKLSFAEEGINFEIEERTDFSDTLKVKNTDNFINYEKDLSEYYQYKNKELGVDSVYFFFMDNKLIDLYFEGDEVTDKEVAKKDKYLRQIIE